MGRAAKSSANHYLYQNASNSLALASSSQPVMFLRGRNKINLTKSLMSHVNKGSLPASWSLVFLWADSSAQGTLGAPWC